jgi:hypothetical protein
MNQSRQEGYYWVKYITSYQIAYWDNHSWYVIGNEDIWQDSDFEHINEVRIKEPGELPD